MHAEGANCLLRKKLIVDRNHRPDFLISFVEVDVSGRWFLHLTSFTYETL